MKHSANRSLGRATRLVAGIMIALAAAGCATSNPTHRQAEADDDGVQATGIIDGARVAVSQGVPEVVFGDCDPGDGPDDDICWVARTIDGLSIAFVVENPDVLAEGEVVQVTTTECTDCDAVADGVVVVVRVNGDSRRPSSGNLDVSTVPGERAAAAFDVSFADGDELRGSFNVRELRPEER